MNKTNLIDWRQENVANRMSLIGPSDVGSALIWIKGGGVTWKPNLLCGLQCCKFDAVTDLRCFWILSRPDLKVQKERICTRNNAPFQQLLDSNSDFSITEFGTNVWAISCNLNVEVKYSIIDFSHSKKTKLVLCWFYSPKTGTTNSVFPSII